MDERKQKRRISNRESARQSRMRKQQYLEDLVRRKTQLKEANGRMLTQIEALSGHHRRLESENAVMRAEAAELTEALLSLNSVLRVVMEPGSVAGDVAEIPGPLLRLRSWQPPLSALPITASADMLEC